MHVENEHTGRRKEKEHTKTANLYSCTEEAAERTRAGRKIYEQSCTWRTNTQEEERRKSTRRQPTCIVARRRQQRGRVLGGKSTSSHARGERTHRKKKGERAHE